MSSIAEIAARYSPPVTDTSKKSSSTVDKDDFMKLLVSQLQHQDPLNPQDPTEFTSQLTQFSSLEQLVNVNSNLDSLTSQQSTNSMLAASTYIGKTARMIGDEFKLTATGGTNLHADIPRDANKVTLNISDGNGKLLRTIDLGKRAAGVLDYAWDGTLADGTPAGAGDYSFEFSATDSKGEAITTTPMVDGPVTSVSFENGKPMLEVGGFAWPLSYLVSIR